MLLLKSEVPVPSDVLPKFDRMVGLADVDQTTPLPVKEEPPSRMVFPPEVAATFVIAVIAVVLNVGKPPSVLPVAVGADAVK
jgi:hypothetical protein